MDDYYTLLGIDPGAGTDEIRAAYRERKDALGAKGDKTAVANLNKAWNVLSDPYQRGRYDAQRDQAASEGELVAAEAPAGDAPPARRRFFEPAPKGGRPPLQPTIELPSGLTFAEQRRRIGAMMIDLFVLLAFFIGSQFVLSALINANYADELDRLDEINEQIDALDEQRDDLPDDAPEREPLDARIDGLRDEYDDVRDELVPTQSAVNGGFFGLGLLYLVVPSALTGQTLGKRIKGVRVLRQNGARLGWAGAISRYGFVVFGTYALSFVLGPLAAAISLIVIMGWMRHPNQQGLHDRMAKTVVVNA